LEAHTQVGINEGAKVPHPDLTRFSGEARLYILVLCFILFIYFFATGTYRWRTAGGTPVVFVPSVWVLDVIHKFSTSLPYIYKRAKCSKF